MKKSLLLLAISAPLLLQASSVDSTLELERSKLAKNITEQLLPGSEAFSTTNRVGCAANFNG